MSDIEGGQAGPDRPDSAGSDSSRSSWLGSLLHRPAQQSSPDGAQGQSGRPFRRFSTVQEETSVHARPSVSASSGATDISFAGGVAPLGTASHSSAVDRSSLQRQAVPLKQLSSGSERTIRRQTQEHIGADSSSSSGGALGAGSAGSGSNGAKALQAKTPSAPQMTAMGDVMVGRMSMQVKVSEGATKKYIHMVSEEEIEEQVAAQKHLFARGVIHPLDRRYRAWWFITVGAAAIAGWLTTYRLAFVNVGYTEVWKDGGAIVEIILIAVFCLDILISFFVGYYDEAGLLVMFNKAVAWYYFRRRFFVDILTTLPWDWMVFTATGVPANSTTGRYIALLSLLKLGRMYRVMVLFYNISYNLSVGLLALTLMRNFTFCFYLLHWAACGFWYIALQQGAGDNKRTWVAQEEQMLSGSSTIELYIFSFYWALVTFATLGYGDVTPNSTPEVVYTIIYVAINIVAWAYVLGTITLLVTKQDEELGRYRQRMQSLSAYCTANNLPKELKQTMAGLLRLHMSLQNEAQGDEQVLSIFPTTIRRKILRQLYSNPLKDCYLFDKTGVKFLDALMLGARVELFLPKVEIVSALDHANELYVVVAGYVEVVDSSLARQAADAATAAEQDKQTEADDNAFTAGVLTSQQLQHAATIAHPPTSLPGSGRLMPLIEGKQQHHDVNGFPPGPSAQLGRVFSAPAGAAHHTGYPGAAATGDGDGAEGSGGGGSSGAIELLERLPGGRRALQWWKSGRSDSWRKQQEQLQRDKYDMNQIPIQALGRASRSLASTSRSLGGSGNSTGGKLAYADFKMPAYAMRNLSTSSKLPQLQKGSVGAGSRSSQPGISTLSASTQSTDKGQATAVPPLTTGTTELGPGDCFAEVAYFTEVPKAEAVRSLTVCRVLVIPRSTYNAVARDFPLSARQVLENLKQRAQELVEEFLPRELAHELLKGADARDTNSRPFRPTPGSGGGIYSSFPPRRDGSSGSGDGAITTAAAGPSAAGQQQQQQQVEAEQLFHNRSPFSASDAQASMQAAGEAAAAAAARLQQDQQQHQPQQGLDIRSPPAASGTLSSSPQAGGSAAAVAAAMRRLNPVAMTAAAARLSSSSGGAAPGTSQRKERPLLSSMSVTLSGRYSAPGGSRSPSGQAIGARASIDLQGRIHSRSSEATMFRRSDDMYDQPSGTEGSAGGMPMSPTSSPNSMEHSSNPDDRAARALARLTVQVNPRHRGSASVGSDAELLARAGDSSHAAFARSTSLRGTRTQGDSAPRQPLSPRQHRQQADDDAQRTLRTISLIPRKTNMEMARAWEGIPYQQQRSASADGGVVPGSYSSQPQQAASGGQQQLPSTYVKLSGLGYEEGSRIYSDEEVQAVAAELPEPLTVQQQRLLADLLRLKRLVNKAAAKFDQMQLTSFLDAAANGDVDVVQDMLRQGMNPNTSDYDGRTALMIAAYKGRKDVVLALLFAGADTSLKDARGFDVMIEGARGSREDIIDVLRRSGARTGISIMLQASLLCKATYEGKLDRLGLLLKAGCNPDAHDYDGQTALHVAAAEGSLAAARVLIQAGASLTIKDRWGYNALDVAQKVGATPLVEYLTAQVPAEVAAASAEGWKRERTEAALAAARYGDTAALARLLARGCPVDAADYDGRSLLHVAVHNKQEAVVQQLLAAGADPNVRSSNGSSVLLEAAMEVLPAIQSELMSAGARLGMLATEEAALLSSVLHARRHDQLLALLTAGADPAAADYDSRTPLHIAASLGDVGALQLMADALADSGIERLTNVNWQAKDRWGDTPLQEAQRAGHQEAAAFLQQQIAQQLQQRQQQEQEAAKAAGTG